MAMVFCSGSFLQKAQKLKPLHFLGRNCPNSLVRQTSYAVVSSTVRATVSPYLWVTRSLYCLQIKPELRSSLVIGPVARLVNVEVPDVAQPHAELSRGKRAETLVQVYLGLDGLVQSPSPVLLVIDGVDLTLTL